MLCGVEESGIYKDKKDGIGEWKMAGDGIRGVRRWVADGGRNDGLHLESFVLDF